MIFTLLYFNLTPCLATIRDDGGEQRLHKIIDLMRQCQYSIHDLSRLEVSVQQIPRMNMPFELGVDFGIRYSSEHFKAKRFLIFELHEHDLKPVLSDISGCDPKAHENLPDLIVKHVRDWIVTENLSHKRTYYDLIGDLYTIFMDWLVESIDKSYREKRNMKIPEPNLPDSEFAETAGRWLKDNRSLIERV
ncbi:MAG: hypothetical protein K8R90_07275 [Candidatus Cloacimonetes bacterium]|nr:hypothetical protein [Candidatus Cloacimonadota bacterium]